VPDDVTMLGRTDSRRRLLVVLVAFVVIGASLCSRLVWWQVVQHDTLAAKAARQTTVEIEVPVRRGTIYDRTGTVVLATTVQRYLVAASPDQLTLTERRDVGTSLAAILGLAPDAASALADKIETDKPYVILARGLEESTADRIRQGALDGKLKAISLEPEAVRVYPQAGGAAGTTLAAHLLGFVNRDGAGQYGVEERYQAALAGTPRTLLADRDVVGRPITDTAQVISPGVPGSDIRLTIDTNLQLAAEQEVLAAYTADEAVGVSAIVMDPRDGAILAEASYPSYDANDYRTIAAKDPAAFVDPIVSDVYEPGSVFKMLTAMAALEQKTIDLSTRILDSGSLSLDHGAGRIYDADRKANGYMAARDIVAYSRNVGAARIALGLANTTAKASRILAAVWVRMGFGRKSGVDLAGEAPGLVRDPALKRWSQVDLANGSFGQGIAVTELQLVTAFAAMANGGKLVTPHVVLGVGDRDVEPADRGQVMSPELSKTLVGLMSHVVHTVPWYAEKTLVRGYDIGGKTGTAQIWDPKLNHGRGGWKANRYNHTFVGYIGRGGPELVIAVTIHEPKPLVISQGNLPLAVESYELFRRIATDAMTMLDLPKPAVQGDR
jgi:cell division protein FtsI/penicillin-binding protein 2